MARTTHDSDAPDKNSTLAPGTQRRLKEKADREDYDFQKQDEILYRRATEGVRDQETLDAVLALGGDATRSSPVREQVLPDAEPGMTTTTGAYRSPIDPTTAAVPASEHSQIAREVGGTPTVGSDGHGEPEERYWPGTLKGALSSGSRSSLRRRSAIRRRPKPPRRTLARGTPSGTSKPTGRSTPATKILTGLLLEW